MVCDMSACEMQPLCAIGCCFVEQVVPLSPTTGVIEMVPATSLSDLLVSESGLHPKYVCTVLAHPATHALRWSRTPLRCTTAELLLRSRASRLP